MKELKIVWTLITRPVTHKVLALSRVLDRFGAYLSHLCSLTEDPSVKSLDREKLTGYVLQWRNAKILVGCAFFTDLHLFSVKCYRRMKFVIWVLLKLLQRPRSRLRPPPLMIFPP